MNITKQNITIPGTRIIIGNERQECLQKVREYLKEEWENMGHFKSYEEAELASLKELIKIVKNKDNES